MSRITESDMLTAAAIEGNNVSPVAGIDQTVGDFKYDVQYDFDAGKGLSERTVRYISDVKKEDPWIREFRLNALKTFLAKPLPTTGPPATLRTSISTRSAIIFPRGPSRSARGTRFRRTSR